MTFLLVLVIANNGELVTSDVSSNNIFGRDMMNFISLRFVAMLIIFGGLKQILTRFSSECDILYLSFFSLKLFEKVSSFCHEIKCY